jgi:integrase
MATFHEKKQLWEARRRYVDASGAKCRKSFWASTEEQAEWDAEKFIRQVEQKPDGTLESYALLCYAPTILHRSFKWRQQVTWATEKWIFPAFGSHDIAGIQRRDVQAFFNQLVADRKLSRSSIGHIRKVFSGIMSLAVVDEVVNRNPLTKIQLPPQPETEVTVWSLDDLGKLVLAAQGSLWQPAILLGAFGLRLGEALGLALEQVRTDSLDVDYQVQNVEGKLVRSAKLKTPGSHRTIPTPEGFYARLLASHSGNSPWVCPNDKGEFLNPENASRAMEAICRRAGVQRGNFHDLRNTFGSLLDDLGFPAPAKRELMGHVGKTVSDRYSRAYHETKLRFLGILLEALDRAEQSVEITPVKRGQNIRYVKRSETNV